MRETTDQIRIYIPDDMLGVRGLLAQIDHICGEQTKAFRERDDALYSRFDVQLKTIDKLIRDMIVSMDEANASDQFAMIRIQTLTLEEYYREYPDAPKIDTNTGLEIQAKH